ncbi:MAG: dTMP kinase [Sporolactobacillus sp.]
MGIFITVEGPNAVGKSTFIKNITQIAEQFCSVHSTKEPSKTELGEYVRRNESKLHGKPYAHLIATDRCYHLEEDILPNLKTHDVVISDRYIESSLVLQKFDGVDMEYIWKLNSDFLVPDLSLNLVAPDDQLEQRLSSRSQLSKFEIQMRRNDELRYYNDARFFLKSKNFNIVVLDNSEVNFDRNLQIACEKIRELVYRK